MDAEKFLDNMDGFLDNNKAFTNFAIALQSFLVLSGLALMGCILAGMGITSRAIFKMQSVGLQRSVNLTDVQVGFIRLACVMFWMNILNLLMLIFNGKIPVTPLLALQFLYSAFLSYGMYFITMFAFNAQSSGQTRSIVLTDVQFKILKAVAVLQWFQYLLYIPNVSFSYATTPTTTTRYNTNPYGIRDGFRTDGFRTDRFRRQV
jgi:hypothetical protein